VQGELDEVARPRGAIVIMVIVGALALAAGLGLALFAL
jgi:hypothetical protein